MKYKVVAYILFLKGTELMYSFFSQLVVSPPVVSTGTFVMVIRMLAIMCGSCPDLAVVLLKQSKYL